jgi:peptidyl-tRNA hydrolase, PTH1 family
VRVILGIGNPGSQYKFNRHNIGFMLVDYLADKYSLKIVPSKNDYYFCEGKVDNSEFSLIKPSTYVNNSGIAASAALNHYDADITDLLVVHDDINLAFSVIKTKISGGDGGHNGLNSIIYHLISDQFPRIRIGVGSNFKQGEMADYVLSNFNPEEQNKLGEIFLTAGCLIEEFIKGGRKQLLDANSKLSKGDQNKSLNND